MADKIFLGLQRENTVFLINLRLHRTAVLIGTVSSNFFYSNL